MDIGNLCGRAELSDLHCRSFIRRALQNSVQPCSANRRACSAMLVSRDTAVEMSLRQPAEQGSNGAYQVQSSCT